jgi:uncharacterized membrane protein (UPF0182 family)
MHLGYPDPNRERAMKTIYSRKRVFWYLVAVILILAITILSTITGKIVEWLWMSQLGYVSVFWRILSIEVVGFALVFILVFLYFWVNLRLFLGNGLRAAEEHAIVVKNGGPVAPGVAKVITFVFSCLPALIFGLIFYSQWDTYLRFRYGGTFGQSDPIYGKDIGFYLFRLPFYELIQNSLVGLTFITFLLILLAYMSIGILQFGTGSPRRREWPAIRHVAILFLFFIGAWVWGYYLDRFELLYSSVGVVYGVGYTAYNVTRISLWIMFYVSLVLAFLVVVSVFRRRFKRILFEVGGYFVLYFVIVTILPGLVQKFKVEPSELELETPFLKHNIDFTRKGFQLEKIEVKTYPAAPNLTLDQISNHWETIQNIRLWDWRPILQTYRQTQEIRLYYEFYEVDMDRYHLEDGYHQVMLSARELAPQLPEKARTWVNEKLQFTHGYGLVMNYVSESTEEGLPKYIIQDIPPVSNYQLNVRQPAIYYGEKTPGYRIVSTQVKEFDYPKGSENVYISYRGKGGIPLDSFWKRTLFAWHFSDINILLTSYLDPESRIQVWRGGPGTGR